MHTIKIDPWRFHHNGDFIGTVVVTNETMPDFAGEDASDWLNAALAEIARLRTEVSRCVAGMEDPRDFAEKEAWAEELRALIAR
jgi:hypothetical protein